jgi:glucosamine--fructose-6-phosphate aminotransferase (isomerizing)
MEKGTNTRTEIFSQHEAWAQALEVVTQDRPRLETLLNAPYDQVLFTGCGSTYYLSLASAALFQEQTGRIARAVPGGELLLNPATALAGSAKTLLIAVSRSGSTTETVRAVEQFQRQKRGPVLAITNYANQPLAGLADLALVIEKGQEQSVAQTRSFASMYVAASALAAVAAGDEHLLQSMRGLPDVGRRLLSDFEPLARRFGEYGRSEAALSFDRYYFLGSGGRYGLACEVNLKLKEMTLTHSEPFHFLEFRHGPMSMVNASTLVVGLLSEKNFGHENAVLQEMQDKGSTVLTLGESGTLVAFASGIPESGRGVLYLPVLQLMAFYRSLAKGLDPDRPHNLSAVIQLDI